MAKRKYTAHAHTLKKQKSESFFGDLSEKQKKVLVIIGISLAALALITLCLVILNNNGVFKYTTGRLRVKGGIAQNVKDGDIVAAHEADGSDTRYYFIGTFDAPDYYAEKPDYRISSDANRSEWVYDLAEENNLNFVYIASVDKSAKEMVEGTDEFQGKTAKGYNYYAYTSSVMNQMTDSKGNYYSKSLASYIEVTGKRCVLVYVTSSAPSAEELTDTETMMRVAEDMMNRVTSRSDAK